jgi:diadenosine tetraphosphate (Ap4A) HIT family hydrolase
MVYDSDNIFARILRGEIPCDQVYEDDHVLAFNDINPRRPVHVLVIPKGEYVSFDDFAANAPDAEIAAFTRAVGRIAREKGVRRWGPWSAGEARQASQISSRTPSGSAR